MTKLAVFDLDGTLLNTFSDISFTINNLRSSLGLKSLDKEFIRKCIGFAQTDFIKSLLPELDIKDVPKFLDEHKDIYINQNPSQIMPYDGIIDMLKKLQNKGVTVAVLSNKNQDAARKACKSFLPNIKFFTVVGDHVGFARKPAPNELLKIIDDCNVLKEETIFIGDGETDVMTAINAGVRGIAVLWGFRDREELEKYGANEFVNNSEQLFDMIINNKQ